MHRRMILPLLFGLIGAAILIGLGSWQMQRLHWKEGLIAGAEARIAEAPVPVPAQPDPATDRYLSVTAAGRVAGAELHVLTSIQGEGPGFLVITAFDLADGRRILLDRGFIPEAAKTDARPPRALTVTGNLNWPDDVNASTPAPDTGRNIWFGRDVAAMAAALGTDPVMLVAREDTGDGIRAQGVTATFRNDHLGYAITWFSLALAWLGMTAAYLWRIRQRTI